MKQKVEGMLYVYFIIWHQVNYRTVKFNFKHVFHLAFLIKYFSKDLKAEKHRQRKQVIRGWVHIGELCAPCSF